MSKPKFVIGEMVFVASHGQAIMMVVKAYPSIVNRYDLQNIKGVRYVNIGEYELNPASDEDVMETM